MSLLPADIMTDAELAAGKNRLIVAQVQKELKVGGLLGTTIDDYSRFARKGVKEINPLKADSFVVQNRPCGTQGTPTKLTQARDSILPNHNAYVSFGIDPCDDIESEVDNLAFAIQRASSAVIRYRDEQILAEAEAHGIAATLGPISYDILLEMANKLRCLDGDFSNVTLVMDCLTSYDLFLKLDEVKRQDIYGVNQAVRTGVVGSFLGAQVIVHPGITTPDTFYMYRKDGIGMAMWSDAQVGSQPCVDYGPNGTRWAVESKFGVNGLQLGQAGAAANESPLICKDGN